MTTTATGDMPDAEPLVRFDDLRANRSFVLTDHVASRCAASLDEVAPLIEAADEHARTGSWVAVMLTYEAGAAFDTAFPRRSPSPTTPLAWFGAFRSRRQVEPLSRPTLQSPPLDVVRRGGTDWFVRNVERCRELIANGLTYQINLTDRFVGRLTGTPFDLYQSMATAQGGAYNAYLDLGELVIVSASPELFLRIEGDIVTARPMKGTARRRSRPDDDERAARNLVDSEKERAENVMIVDLLRNDLSRLARLGGVSVPSLFTAERYETVWQLTSTVRAELRPSVGLVDILRATFPCGSVTGAPKIAAMQFIDQIEPWPRGVYCGSIGLIEPAPPGIPDHRPAATFNVAIRTAVVETSSGVVEFGAGGGVTWGSEPELEDAEVEAKAAVLTAYRPDFQLLETLRAQGPCAINLDAHLRRLASSARYFGFRCDLAAMRRSCVEAIRSEAPNGDRRMRILLSRDGELRVELHPLESVSTRPVRLAVAPSAVRSDDVFCCHKTTNRALYDRIAARHPDVDDVLLVNERGEVTETCRANVIFRCHDEWFTPPLASGGLAGIARQLLVDNGDVSERVLALDQLGDVEEFAVVSSLRGRRSATLEA